MEICRNIKIRILAFMMAFWLAFSVSYNDYQEVKALEWVIPTVAFDTAIKFLLGLLGVSLTSKALHDNVDWNQVQQDCVDFQIQKGNDAVAVGEWWEDVAKGTLNQASSCWTAFKEWAQSLISTSVNLDSVVVEAGTYTIDNVEYNIKEFNAYFNTYTFNGLTVTGFFSSSSDYVNGEISNFFISSMTSFDVTVAYPIRSGSFTYNDKTVYYIYPYRNYSYAVSPTIDNLVSNANPVFSDYAVSLGLMAWLSVYSTSGDIANKGIFDSANENIEDTAITTDTPTTTAIPDTLPLPWDNVSDTAEGVDDAISALQEQVAEGVISLEDYWERVQELINAMAIDTTTDEVLPTTQNPDTGENETIQDKIQENTSNGSFTLGGMEKVFPFCIPWDIYDFVTLLVAPPVAPVINYPFYNPVTGQDINISIDFSDWENVVVLFRYILDFLLIIGLLLLARQLAGAGGDD